MCLCSCELVSHGSPGRAPCSCGDVVSTFPSRSAHLLCELHGLLGGEALALPAVPTGVLYVVPCGSSLPAPPLTELPARSGLCRCDYVFAEGTKWPTGTWRGLKQHGFICPVACRPFPGRALLASTGSEIPVRAAGLAVLCQEKQTDLSCDVASGAGKPNDGARCVC